MQDLIVLNFKEQKEGLEFNHDQYKEIEKFCLEKKN